MEELTFGASDSGGSTVKVALVAYTNSIPFNRALEKLPQEQFQVARFTPRECFQQFRNQQADLALVPTGALLSLNEYKLVSPFCIGAQQNIRTVSLLSNSQLQDLHTVYLDSHSLTSINLFKVLNRQVFKLSKLNFKHCPADFDYKALKVGEAAVAIGDKVFELEKHFTLNVDLAEAWYQHTGYGFVFACWVAKPCIDLRTLAKFNQAVSQELQHLHATELHPDKRIQEYIQNTVQYSLTPSLQTGMNLYLQELKMHQSEHFFLD